MSTFASVSKKHGDEFFSKGNYEEASVEYLIARNLAQEPQEKDMYDELAVSSFVRMEKYDSLFQYIKKNVNNAEERTLLIANIGDESLKAACNALKGKNYAEALKLCNRLLLMHPNNRDQLPADLELKLHLLKKTTLGQMGNKEAGRQIEMHSKRLEQLTPNGQFGLHLDHFVSYVNQNDIGGAVQKAHECLDLLQKANSGISYACKKQFYNVYLELV